MAKDKFTLQATMTFEGNQSDLEVLATSWQHWLDTQARTLVPDLYGGMNLSSYVPTMRKKNIYIDGIDGYKQHGNIDKGY
jgi:hypothetical protein